jgi:hypothetical protein
MLAGWLLTSALGLLRPTLDVKRVVSRNSQTIVLEHDDRLKCSEATTLSNVVGNLNILLCMLARPASVLCHVLPMTGSL